VENANSIIMRCDAGGAITFVSEFFLHLLGYSEDEVIGKHAFGTILPEFTTAGQSLFAAIRESAQQPGAIKSEAEVMCKDGRRVLLSRTNKAITDAVGRFAGILAIGSDIPERRRVEEALFESEAKYRKLFDIGPDALLPIDAETGAILDANPAAVALYGYSRDELLGMRHVDLSAEPEKTRQASIAALSQKAVHIPLRYHRKKDGTVFPVEITMVPCTLGGRSALLPTIHDITDRKRIEQELQESKKQLAAFSQMLAGVLEHTHMMAVLLDTEFNFIWVNRAYADTCRHDPSFFPGKNHFDLYPDVENEAIFQRVVTTGEPFFAAAKPFVFPDQPERGVTYWDWSLIPVKDESGTITGLVFTLADVTGRVQAEESLQISEERLRLAHKATNDVVWDWDIVHDAQHWNEAGAIVFGWTDIVERPQTAAWWVERVHPEDRQRIEEGFSAAVDNPAATRWQDEYRFRKADGTYAQVLDRGYVLRNGHGKPIRMIGAMLDITERKKAEETLQKINARLDLLAETAGALLASAQPQAVVQSLCLKVMELLDCQAFFHYLVDEETGRLHLSTYSGVPPEEAHRIEWLDPGVAVCGCVAREGHPIFAEDILASQDVRTELVKSYGMQAYACHPLIAMGRVLGTLSFGTRSRTRFALDDIALMKAVTDQVAIAMQRRHYEDHLLKSLHEKEVLLREVHHRVKNNMAVIASILDLQKSCLPEGAVLNAFDECKHRINSMALVHDCLYQSEDLDRIDMARYLGRLVATLQRSYAAHEFAVFTDIDVGPDMLLDIEHSMPCALIITELYTNALKHAFCAGSQGRISIAVAIEQGVCALIFSDNGCGLPAQIDIAHTDTLGLQLVRLLTAQLGGHLEIDRSGGTKFNITFKV